MKGQVSPVWQTLSEYVFGPSVVLGSFVWVLNTSPGHQEITLGLVERLRYTIDLALLTTVVRPRLTPRPR